VSTISITTVLEARSSAAEWLLVSLPDRFAAGIPENDPKRGTRRIPVWLSYPGLDPLGPVGELTLDKATGILKEHTPIDEMKASALGLYEQHRDEIEAAFKIEL
jgi:hypothetical protein